MSLFFRVLVLVASLGFFVAVYYSFRLSKETRHEPYWLALALSAIFLAISEWSAIPWQAHIINADVRELTEQITAALGAILFGYAVYGLARSMKMVREKIE